MSRSATFTPSARHRGEHAMAAYQFRYFVATSDDPVGEHLTLKSDGEARARAASELLRLPDRRGVDVWNDGRLVYTHRRWP